MNTVVWRMLIHHIDREGALDWTRKNGRIAIGGGSIGDVRNYSAQSEIRNGLRQHYPSPPYSNNSHLMAPSLWDFCHTLKKDDLVILNGRVPRALVVRVTGDYDYVLGNQFIENVPGCEYYNQRLIEITAIDPNKLWASVGEAPGKSRYQTLIQCAKSVNIGNL
jgi:hypothetical protein